MSEKATTTYNAHLLWKSAIERSAPIILLVKFKRIDVQDRFSRYPTEKVEIDTIKYRFNVRGLTTPSTHWVCDVERWCETTKHSHPADIDRRYFNSIRVPSVVETCLSKTLFDSIFPTDSEYIDEKTLKSANIISFGAEVK